MIDPYIINFICFDFYCCFFLLLFAIYHIFILMSTQSVRPADCLAVYLSASHSFDYSVYYNIAGGVDTTHVDLSHIIPVRGGQNHLYHRFIRYSLVQLCTSVCVARCYFSYHDDEIIRLYSGNYDFDLGGKAKRFVNNLPPIWIIFQRHVEN